LFWAFGPNKRQALYKYDIFGISFLAKFCQAAKIYLDFGPGMSQAAILETAGK
jgi:hypothetical protein